ncbi:MAG: serine hydrolase domain-containing protein [Pseudomonadota bacterium]
MTTQADRLTTGKASGAGMDADLLTRVTAGMQQLVDAGQLAGTVTIAARNNRIVHFEAVGQRDIERGLPMQKDTIFRIYSMTKPVTGVALMMLYDEGKFSLSDPLSKYIPEFAEPQVYVGTDEDGNFLTEPAEQAITIRHLMTHTAGLAYGTMMGNHPVDVAYSDADIFNPDSNLETFTRKVANLPLKWQPGTRHNYSAAVEIQGYLVELLSGQRFGDFLQERLFGPLGMQDTAFSVSPDKLDRFAQVYHYNEQDQLIAQELFDGAIRFTEDQTLQAGGWGLVSTAMDYLRFSQMLLNGGTLDGTRILSPATVKLMHTNHLPAGVTEMSPMLGGQPGSSFGLDFAIIEDPVENGSAYSKGEYYWGGAAGTWFWIDPVENLVFVGMVQQFAGQPQIPDVRGISKRAFYTAITELRQP